MKRVDAKAKRVLILAPKGRDGAIAQSLLREAGFDTFVCESLPKLVDALVDGAASAILTEEALQAANITSVAMWLNDQPSWSDFPFILLSSHGGGLERNPEARRWTEVLGNVTVIERPFHPTTLTAAVASAQRARLRQYEARARADELRAGQDRLRTAMEAADLGAWQLHLGTNLLETSADCRAHYGLEPDDAFDFDAFREAVHPDDFPAIEAAARRAMETSDDYACVYRVRWPDASEHWIDARGQATADVKGEVTGLVGVTADITARKRAEAEREALLSDLAMQRSALSDLNSSLEQRVVDRSNELMLEVAAREQAQDQLRQAQKMESIGQLTGGVAHDFNNLLMVVTSALTLLKRRVPDTPQIKRLIDGAVQAAERGASLTQRLLAFARQQDLKVNRVDLSKLVAGMSDLLERSLGPRFDLDMDVPVGLPAAEADANQLELAILNLVINARDAMRDGGTISVRVGTAARERVQDMEPGRYLSVTVSDNGTGMDSETLKKAIEPFFSTKAVGKGTGLGLSMVHGLAVQLGGAFQLESEIGRGTTAVILLPVAQGAADEVPDIETAETALMSGRVLVVDDDLLVAELTSEMLRELGHHVTTVNSGKAALDILRGKQHVDLLLTDYLMPGMTGATLVCEARALRPDLPVLMATGFADTADGIPSDIPRIPKPYDLNALRTRLSELRTP